MNTKIHMICFMVLFFVLISTVNASDSDNETLENTNQPDPIQEINSDELFSKSNLEEVPTSASENAETEQSAIAKDNPLTSTKAKAKVKLKAPDVEMYYKDGTSFKVTLKDQNNKIIKNAKIKIKIDGKTYTKTTNNKGIVQLSLKLKSGTYTAKTTYEGSSVYAKKSVSSKITVKSTIKCGDVTKFYKSISPYCAIFYDKKGTPLKNTEVKIMINGKTYSVKTNNNGLGGYSINLKPGTYNVKFTNTKTSESVTKTIKILSILKTNDLTMNYRDGSNFTVKVLNSNGQVAPNKEVKLKIDGKAYLIQSDSNGIATQAINLPEGKYTITTEYAGLKNTNQITVNEEIVENQVKKSTFIHSIIIPNYVNVTIPYAFHNSAYTLKTGINGTVKMPKIEVYTIEIGSKIYKYATGKTNLGDVIPLDDKSHLIRFDGLGLMGSANKDYLKGNGIIITKTPTYIQIDYRDETSENIELFGFYADKGADNSETFTYMKNDKVIAKVNVQTQFFDETGVKYSLAKYYQRPNTDFNYYEIINHVTDPIVFTNTGTPVTYSYFTNYIAGYPTREDVITKFSINGHEELEKIEQISYGLADKYRRTMGFEVLQSYTIINEKVTRNIVENWTSKNSLYLNRFGVMNVYGMHLASLETAWLADELANNYGREFNVNWKRDKTVTILGGINLEDTYLHILNADMGMSVNGDDLNTKMFRLMNSAYLPNIESYVLTPLAERYGYSTINSLSNVIASIESDEFSIVQMGEMFYILCENTGTAMIINSTSGIANVILVDDDFAYKGSTIKTISDCCSVGIMPTDLINGIQENLNKFGNCANDIINGILNKIHPLSVSAYMLGNVGIGIAGKLITSSAMLSLSTTVGLIMGIHGTGNYIKNNMVDKKDWHWAYEHVTFTRDGYMQNKKFFNIPKSDGTYDYIEVGINPDGSLNRDDALYVSPGSCKKLTKSETYNYFSEESWTPYNIPKKYLKNQLP